MKYIAFFIAFFYSISLQAQSATRSGLNQNTIIEPSLRSFPCAGTTIYEEDFNTLQAGEIPADWQVLDLDTLTPNDNISYLTKGWQRILDFKDSTNIAMASPSWYKSPSSSDDWLITKKITVGENSCLSWYAYSQDIYYPERYDVLVSTTGTDTADFTANPILRAVSGEFYSENYRSASLADYKNKDIYVAFRQRSYDKFVLVLDNIRFAEVEKIDLATHSIRVNPYSDTSKIVIVKGAFINVGSDTLKFDSAQLVAHYQILANPNGAIQDMSINKKISLAPNDTLNWVHDSLWTTPNVYGVVQLCAWFTGIINQPINNDILCIDFGIYPTAISGQIPAKYIQVYPNPASDILKVNVDGEIANQELYLSIVDIYGNLVYQQNRLGLGETEISINGFSTGMYFVHIRDKEGKTFSTKWVKY